MSRTACSKPAIGARSPPRDRCGLNLGDARRATRFVVGPWPCPRPFDNGRGLRHIELSSQARPFAPWKASTLSLMANLGRMGVGY